MYGNNLFRSLDWRGGVAPGRGRRDRSPETGSSLFCYVEGLSGVAILLRSL